MYFLCSFIALCLQSLLGTKRKKVSAWSDWRWQLRHALTDIDEVFCAVYGLNLPATRTVQARYPVFLTPYALSQLTPSAPAGL